MAGIIAHAVFVLLFMALNLLFDRNEFFQYLPVYIGLFLSYLAIFRFSRKQIINSILLALLLRITCLVIFPGFSEDFYRFHWDGLMLSQGISPYEMTPRQLLDSDLHIEGADQALFDQLNSADYYSVYPPLAQMIFSIGAWIFPLDLLYSMISFKLILLLFEIGSVYLLIKILQARGLNPSLSLLYIWNPLVLLEGAINMHLELMVIFFILLFIWTWQKHRFIFAGSSLALAALIKLVPLIFLPIILLKTTWKKSLLLLVSFGGCFLAFHIPIYSLGDFSGLLDSIKLYFNVFEFNGSIYYLASWIGMKLTGYNAISTIGPITAIISGLSILIFSWINRKANIIESMIWILFIYLIFATTVHPWYIIPFIALGTIRQYYFPFAWSFLIFLSYSAYQSVPAQENYLLIALEYVFLGLILIWDLRFSDRSFAD